MYLLCLLTAATVLNHQECVIKQRGRECVTPKFVKPAEPLMCAKYRMLLVVEPAEPLMCAKYRMLLVVKPAEPLMCAKYRMLLVLEASATTSTTVCRPRNRLTQCRQVSRHPTYRRKHFVTSEIWQRIRCLYTCELY